VVKRLPAKAQQSRQQKQTIAKPKIAQAAFGAK
jgi:hypothetical protein